jgi:hypothetical protein
MSKEAEKLAKVFTIKEEVDGFISNLEHLKSDGSVTPDMYSTLKSDYEQRKNASLSEIDRIKSEIKDLLEANRRERDIQANELRKLEIRYKAGEFTEDEYRESRRKLQDTVAYLDERTYKLSNLMKAQSSGDIAGAAGRVPPPAASAVPPSPPPEAPPRERPPKAGRRFKLPGRKALIAIGAVVVVIVIAVVAVLMLPGGKKEEVNEVAIPVDVFGAGYIGSLHFELVYDTTVLEVVNVEGGMMAGNALFESDITSPGRVIVGMVSSGGITGDGPVAMITFNIKNKNAGSTSLVLESVAAHSSLDLSKLPVSYVAGNFEIKDGSYTPPTMYFASPSSG